VRLAPRQYAALLAACQDDSLIRLDLTLGSMSVGENEHRSGTVVFHPIIGPISMTTLAKAGWRIQGAR
jgi:hypothetical protein